MNISIPRDPLINAVNKVKNVVSTRSALPILSHLFIEAKEDVLHLAGTDLKVSIECTVPCTVSSPGVLTAACQRLASVLSELPNTDISLSLVDDKIVGLTCGKIETKLFSMPPEEFPPIRQFEGVEPLTIGQKTLKELFSKTSFAICTDQGRYNLTGCLFEIQDGRLTIVATDGRRMSLALEEGCVPEGIDVKVIIPGKMVHELERLLADEGDVAVYIDESQAAFGLDDVRLTTSLIEGAFPNYSMVIPKKHDKEILLETAVFSDAVRRTRTMTNEKFNSVRFHFAEGMMTLKVVTPEVGEYVEEMPVDYKGAEVEIAFNPDFLLDILRRVETESISLILKDGMSPGLIKPYTDHAVDSYLNVIMPIRI